MPAGTVRHALPWERGRSGDYSASVAPRLGAQRTDVPADPVARRTWDHPGPVPRSIESDDAPVGDLPPQRVRNRLRWTTRHREPLGADRSRQSGDSTRPAFEDHRGAQVAQHAARQHGLSRSLGNRHRFHPAILSPPCDCQTCDTSPCDAQTVGGPDAGTHPRRSRRRCALAGTVCRVHSWSG